MHAHCINNAIKFAAFSFFLNQMGAYTIQDAMTWKEKIELVIDQVLGV